MSVPALAIDGLTHRYKGATRLALNGVSFEVQPGEAFAVLGPNGGGKSTTFRILATLMQPAADGSVGHASVFGHDVMTHPADARRAMGVVFQSPSVDIKLTALENLLCHARLFGLSKAQATPRIDPLLERFGLSDRRNDLVEAFSGGMRRKLEIAKALIHQPRLLLMDEPATGLDPAARRDLWDLLSELRRQQDLTIVWTTHLMDEAEHADRLAILADGRVVTVQTPGQLTASIGGHVVTVEPSDPAELPTLRAAIAQALGPWGDGGEPIVDDTAVRFEHADGPATIAQITTLWPGSLRRVSVGRPTLEDAYLRLTRGAAPVTADASSSSAA